MQFGFADALWRIAMTGRRGLLVIDVKPVRHTHTHETVPAWDIAVTAATSSIDIYMGNTSYLGKRYVRS